MYRASCSAQLTLRPAEAAAAEAALKRLHIYQSPPTASTRSSRDDNIGDQTAVTVFGSDELVRPTQKSTTKKPAAGHNLAARKAAAEKKKRREVRFSPSLLRTEIPPKWPQRRRRLMKLQIEIHNYIEMLPLEYRGDKIVSVDL